MTLPHGPDKLSFLLLPVKCQARWLVTIAYFPPIPSLDVLLTDDINFVFRCFLFHSVHIFLPFPLTLWNTVYHWLNFYFVYDVLISFAMPFGKTNCSSHEFHFASCNSVGTLFSHCQCISFT